MIQSTEIPPLYYLLHDRFGVEWEKGVVITFGNKYYCKYELKEDVIAHEECHMLQQMVLGPQIWWNTWLEDPEFRLSQEVEAYRAQVKYLKENTDLHTRNIRRFAYKKLAEDLSGSMYGNIISYDEAYKLIT